MNKYTSRERRGRKTKALLKFSSRPRLVIFRSNAEIYAQIVTRGEAGDNVLVSCSTKDTEIQANLKGTKSEKALLVGELLGKRAKTKEILAVAFDRSGYKYHGRVRALAEGARKAGLEF